MALKAVIFDLDGTLLDTLKDLAYAGNHTLSALGFKGHDIDQYRAMVGNGIGKLVERMLPEQNRQKSTFEVALSLFQRYYQQHMSEYTTPYSGIPELLKQLKEKELKLGILSNKQHEYMDDIVQHYFPDIFDAVLGFRTNEAPKPHPSGMEYLLEQLHVDKAQVLYCGDSDIDMQTAIYAKVEGCGVTWGFRSEQQLIEAGASCIVHDTNQLLQQIEQRMV